MFFVCNGRRCRVTLVKRCIMWVVYFNSIWGIFIPLKFDRVLNYFYYDCDHWCNLGNNVRAHSLGSIWIPLVFFPILDDLALSLVDNLGLVYGLFQHFVGIVFYQLRGRLNHFSLSLLNNLLVGPQIGRELFLYHRPRLNCKLFNLVVKRCSKILEGMIDVPDDALLLQLFLN